MRSITLILAFILCLGVKVFPQTKQETTRVELNKRVTVDGGRISIKFLEVVEDSRCPVDVTCVWGGNAKVKVAVGKGRSTPKILELNTTLDPNKVDVFGYMISLFDLYPHKGERVANAAASVVLVVKRK